MLSNKRAAAIDTGIEWHVCPAMLIHVVGSRALIAWTIKHATCPETLVWRKARMSEALKLANPPGYADIRFREPNTRTRLN